ncbi:FmdB family zinc ribbon protein [Legionella sp. km772]|uniref:FmdB family zinc ribbon protein n=1 Tax=Legionella sp. km772 TaxID=2498111 RepID=UPI000F8C8A45|nr:zinc ribbon domain-containing protein [Legionella sp. km772]RUR12954.1 zinc ribbon domain-containing protein [Legionella sp. km772]
MPIYEYQCSNCHHQFDAIQKISDEPLKECPECHKETAVKLVSAAGFQLKGTGWYVTDFKNKNTNSTPGTKAAETKSTETTSTSSTTEGSKGGSE